MDNELKSLDAVEREIRARYNGKYQSAPEYQASERATRKAILNYSVLASATCITSASVISISIKVACRE